MLGKYTSPIENLGVDDPWINVMLYPHLGSR